jgi:chromosome segregation ATPase
VDRLEHSEESFSAELDRLESVLAQKDAEIRRLKSELDLRDLYLEQLHAAFDEQAAELASLDERLRRLEPAELAAKPRRSLLSLPIRVKKGP